MKLLSGFVGFWNRLEHKINPKKIAPKVTVYRAVTKKVLWPTGGNPDVQIFLLRPNEVDLSLLSRLRCANAFCEGCFRSCYGEVGLLSDEFINRGLKLKKTPQASTPECPAGIPNHVSAFGLDLLAEAEARNLAFDLLEQLTVRNPRSYKRPKNVIGQS